jgi:septal ring factor EnvC (AmiA/AmiB activator)
MELMKERSTDKPAGDLRTEVAHRFDLVDHKFAVVDEKFTAVDKRFEQVDKRFEQVDKRFEQVDKRFEQVDKRFEQVDKRFEQVEGQIQGLRTEMNGGFEAIAKSSQKTHHLMVQSAIGMAAAFATIIAALLGLIATQV